MTGAHKEMKRAMEIVRASTRECDRSRYLALNCSCYVALAALVIWPIHYTECLSVLKKPGGL